MSDHRANESASPAGATHTAGSPPGSGAGSRAVAGDAIVPGWSLAFGEIRHARLQPVAHAFRYNAFFACADANDLDGSARGNWLFGINRKALLSFREADHGEGGAVLPWLKRLLAEAGIKGVTRFRYQGFVRVLGYAFKPVSFWHCMRGDGATVAIVAEVNNTFGERHCYLLSAPEGTPLSDGQLLRASKCFHVSPFFGVTGSYRFRFLTREPRTVMRIDHVAGAGGVHDPVLLTTSMSGRMEPLSTRRAWRALLRYPMFTVGVMARIHWHALRLVLKRVRFFSKPNPPADFVTSGRPAPLDPSS